MEGYQETKTPAGTISAYKRMQEGTGSEVKRKRLKHLLYISSKFLNLTREITLEEEN
jgi:hypothetical protein